MARRSLAAWVVRQFWFRAVLALLAGYVLLLPLGQIPAQQQRQALAATGRAHRVERLQIDVQSLQLGMVIQFAGIRGYVLSADPRFLSGYDTGRSMAGTGWSALSTDARGSELQGELPALQAAMDAWQTWAAVRREATDVSRAAAPPAALREGQPLFDRFQSAAERLDSLSASLAARYRAESDRLEREAVVVGTLSPIAGPAVLVVLGSVMLWLALRPLSRLARAANRLAGGLEPDIPYSGRRDQIGAISKALGAWQQGATAQRAIWLYSPVSMVEMGVDMQTRGANPATEAMYGWDFNDMLADSAQISTANVTHPDYRKATAKMYRRLMKGQSDVEQMEKLFVRKDGSTFWAKSIVVALRDGDGQSNGYVGMVEDITERKEKLLRAAQVQRDLLPDSTPDLPGYELTGLCRPTEDVGGDFFDWYQQDPGTLTLTVADVMGKGMPAAILMATMRIALRSSGWAPSAEEAVRSVADSTQQDLEKTETFMTLFHARLDLESGQLTYVDAGHSLAVVVNETGGTWLRSASMPIGVMPGTKHPEASVTLQPGDTLVVFSDGVLDLHPELEEDVVGAARRLMKGAESVQEMAERIATNPQARVMDDVTVVVLRREAAPTSAAAGKAKDALGEDVAQNLGGAGLDRVRL
jgi:PAS domain S-box-containing protein